MSELLCWPQGADSLMEETQPMRQNALGVTPVTGVSDLGMTSQRKQHLNLTLRGK